MNGLANKQLVDKVVKASKPKRQTNKSQLSQSNKPEDIDIGI